jgi:hypothetical protein
MPPTYRWLAKPAKGGPTSFSLFPQIAGKIEVKHRLVDQPPVLFHVAEADFGERVREGLVEYRQTLSDERRVLLDHYRLEDYAMKVGPIR